MAESSSARARVQCRLATIAYYNNPEYVLDSRDHAQRGGRNHAKLRILKTFITAGPVLELGSGAGLYAEHLPGYIGVDISQEAIRHAEKGARRMVCGDIQALPLTDESVAAVFSFNVLEHIDRPDMVIDEIDRVLMRGGTVLLKDTWRRASVSARAHLPKRVLKLKGTIETRMRIVRRSVTGRSNVEYSELEPDFSRIGHDFDAVSSIDEFSIFAYFESRGYECLNIRRNLLLRLMLPYRDFKHWVIVRKSAAATGKA